MTLLNNALLFLSKKNVVKNINYKNNCFNLLSLMLSIIVIIFHSYYLYYGINTKKIDFITKNINGETLGTICVVMFFIISGFLITNSIKNSKSIFTYVKKRIKRIAPPLLFCLSVSALIIAPICLKINFIQYIKNPNNYIEYIIDNLFLVKNTIYNILDVFKENPYPYTINGSLWTLKHQVFMYVLIILIYIFFIKNEKHKKNYLFYYVIIMIMTILSYFNIFDSFFIKAAEIFNNIGIIVEGKWLIKLICYFSSGVLLNIYSDKVPYKPLYVIIAFFILFFTRKSILFRFLCLLIIPYITIFIACLNNKFKFWDISYYVYLWGFPIQQLIVNFLKNNISFIIYNIISLITILFISLITYYIFDYKRKKLRKNEG